MASNEGPFNNQQLIEQLEVWQHNRMLYPGWLIAPKDTRDQIWNFSKEWISAVYAAKDRWPAEHLLVLYREIFWRLDVALHYLPNDLAEAADVVLSHFKSQIGQPYNEDTVRQCGWPDKLALSASALRENWVEVACHVLRHFRISQNKVRYERLRASILSLASPDDDVNSRLAYDKCVWAISINDMDSCLNALNDWPVGPADPYWQVKRGALFAELGDADKAKSLMESALVALRSTQRLGTTNISAMSRESWTLQHLWQISAARERDPSNETRNDAESQKRRDRQRELEAYRCSAKVEMRLLQSSIEGRPKQHSLVGRRE